MEIKCDQCGEVFKYRAGPAHFKRTKHHYCSVKCQADAQVIHGFASKKRNNGRQTTRYQMLMGARKRAKRRGMECTIEIADIPNIPKICPVLGIEIKVHDSAGPIDSSPSLDRMESMVGYVPENIRIISNRANRLRQDATLEEMKLLVEDAKRIQNHNR